MGGSSPATAAEIAASVQQDKESLLTGIREGRPFYFKEEEYRRNPIGFGGLGTEPNTVILENWVVAGDDGQIEDLVATKRSLEGDLLGYSQLTNGRAIYTDVATGTTLDEFTENWGTLESSVSASWDGLLSLQRPEFEFKGRGTLNQRASLIYELQTSKGKLLRIEVVEDAPLLHKTSLYEGASPEQSSLLEQRALIEYRLLPVGSAFPDPATEG